MTRTEYRKDLYKTLVNMDTEELRKFAAENDICVFTTYPIDMREMITEVMISRKFDIDISTVDSDQKLVELKCILRVPKDTTAQLVENMIKTSTLGKVNVMDINCSELTDEQTKAYLKNTL